jgi:hypothetical protein
MSDLIDEVDELGAYIERLDRTTRGLRNLLLQNRFWISKEGVRHPLDQMRPSYARNIIKWLEARAEVLYEATCVSTAFNPGPSGEMAQDHYDEGVNQLFDTDPGVWLNQQVLMVALRKIVVRDS